MFSLLIIQVHTDRFTMATIRTFLFPLNARSIVGQLASRQSLAQPSIRPLLPIISLSVYPSSSRFLPAAIASTVSSLLADLWDSVLRAVPKKKTSHSKKRHRQMAGKALKDAININRCPVCGEPKRTHLLCPTCVRSKQIFIPNS